MMAARAGVYALALGAALATVWGAELTDKANAQSDDVTVQAEEAPVQAAVATTRADDVTAQDEAVEQPIPRQKPAAVDRPAKSDLDQSAVRAAPVVRAPRATRTSTRSIVVPKILGSYR